jgi:hypothetical protein
MRTVAGEHGANMTRTAVAATATFRQRAVTAEVNSDGYDGYLTSLGVSDGSYPTAESVAVTELEPGF